MQLTGQNNGGIASSCVEHKLQRFRLEWPFGLFLFCDRVSLKIVYILKSRLCQSFNALLPCRIHKCVKSYLLKSRFCQNLNTLLCTQVKNDVCVVSLSLYSHRASWEICLTTVGIEPTSLRGQVGSSMWIILHFILSCVQYSLGPVVRSPFS